MPEEKKKLSKLCLTGFLISILSPVMMILYLTAFSEWINNSTLYWIVFAVILLFPVAGLVLSIAGLVSAKKKSRKGKGFGIAGIVLTGVYAVVGLIIFLIVALIISAVTPHKSDRQIPSFYTTSNVVSVRYYYREEDGYRTEDLDESKLKEFVSDLYSMEIKTGGMMDYYWGGSFGIEMKMEDGSYVYYDGTKLESTRKSRLDDQSSYGPEKRQSEFVYVMNYDFWDVMKKYFPSIEENGDKVFAKKA